MRILALNAYHGGSHAAFLNGWIAHSRHDWTVLTLPAHHWKWRMRHAAITFADRLRQLDDDLSSFDAVFCTDMLNLAEFLGLAPKAIVHLPVVVYFHESQLLYPDQTRTDRDLHFALTNITTALAADCVWFNSAYHRDAFLSGSQSFLARMPDHQHVDMIAAIAAKSSVEYPGVNSIPSRSSDRSASSPLRIVWAARWEHDKAPEHFFAAMEQLNARGTDFQLSVLGQSFDTVPDCFEQTRQRLKARIEHWGYVEDHAEYQNVLRQSDVFVSTARHEFFGMAAVEAALAGCLPILPRRLAYPEVFTPDAAVFYDPPDVDALVTQLIDVSTKLADANWRTARINQITATAQRYCWIQRALSLDDHLESLKRA